MALTADKIVCHIYCHVYIKQFYKTFKKKKLPPTINNYPYVVTAWKSTGPECTARGSRTEQQKSEFLIFCQESHYLEENSNLR
jgi:hypothetical protein